MIRTIILGNYISVQGEFVRALPDGRIVVRCDQAEFVGVPVVAPPPRDQATPVAHPA